MPDLDAILPLQWATVDALASRTILEAWPGFADLESAETAASALSKFMQD
jgi:hypothetical protein